MKMKISIIIRIINQWKHKYQWNRKWKWKYNDRNISNEIQENIMKYNERENRNIRKKINNNNENENIMYVNSK